MPKEALPQTVAKTAVPFPSEEPESLIIVGLAGGVPGGGGSCDSNAIGVTSGMIKRVKPYTYSLHTLSEC